LPIPFMSRAAPPYHWLESVKVPLQVDSRLAGWRARGSLSRS
jgi:hypothetical protein